MILSSVNMNAFSKSAWMKGSIYTLIYHYITNRDNGTTTTNLGGRKVMSV